MQIRVARESDIPGLAETHLAAWHAAYRGLMPDAVIDAQTLENRVAGWTKTLADGNRRNLACIIDDRVVGFSSYCKSRDQDASSDEAELVAMYVHPEFWRAGLGRALCRETFDQLRKEYRTAIVWVLRENQKARRFYEAMGFALVERKEKQLPWFGNVPEVCYRKSLTEVDN
jgi:ribosomal protein S18 acetylase RimI-like enzyme